MQFLIVYEFGLDKYQDESLKAAHCQFLSSPMLTQFRCLSGFRIKFPLCCQDCRSRCSLCGAPTSPSWMPSPLFLSPASKLSTSEVSCCCRKREDHANYVSRKRPPDPGPDYHQSLHQPAAVRQPAARVVPQGSGVGGLWPAELAALPSPGPHCEAQRESV